MKNLNRVVAVLLATVMFCLMPVADMTVKAEDTSDTSITENDSYQTEKSEIEENVEADSSQEESQSEQEVDSQEVVSDGLLNYVGIDKPYLTSPDTQKIVVSYGDGTEAISEAKIIYQKADGTIVEDAISSRQEEIFLFEHSFSSEDKGTYTLLRFVYVEDGIEQTIELQDIGVEAMFGVDEEYPGYNSDSSDVISQEEIDTSVVSVDSDEVATAQEEIADAIDNTEDGGIAAYSSEEQTKNGNIVVVLDPGHGGSDGGAVANGLQEKDLNLKIAKYCKEELEQYSGVTVYMTREGDSYLGDRVGDAASDLANRVSKAKEWGADLLVSIHINSGGGQGVEVYYPNSNYNATIGKNGEDSAQQILDELVKLGLKSRGIKIRTVSYDKYPDGSLEDWYGIIRRSKYAGFTGIIVEHAFIDNVNDAVKLKDESFLKQCGIADATGIAKHYGLSKEHWEQVGSQWKYNNGDGTYKTSQWLLLKGVWYYFDSKGIMQTGWTKVGDATYYMNTSGAMQTGWLHLDDTWYYFETSGARVNGCWKWINSKCYYFDVNGCMAADTWIGDYYVDANGAWIAGKQRVTPGWKSVSGRWKYLESNGEYVKSRWLLVKNIWYHFDANGYMQTGWLSLNSKWYYFESSGAMVTDRWRWINGKCYYFDNNGYMAANTWIGDYYVDSNGAWVKGKQKPTSGWKKISGRWKYVESNGNYAQSKWLQVGSSWYHFDANGYMQTGWLSLNNKWYYLESSGAMVTDRWRWINSKCYYFDNNGYMAADTWIGDYYVDASGAWIADKQKVVPGWKEISGRKKYMEESGEYAKSKWLQIGTGKYYFDADEYMHTGWLALDDEWYYLASDGVMVSDRWRWINNVCYYFYSNGRMAADTWIGDYYVDANGAWIADKKKLTDIMGSSSVTASQLANFYKTMNKQYPSYYSKNDEEAKTIEDFCKIYVEECKSEGVRVEVAFAQAMLETGYLSFVGDVDISQYNFAGMGATGNGVKGNSFSTVRIGIRAQVQHLKCYASTEKLNGDCVDPRWGEWLRGKAPYVEWLSIPNNPYGTGWASSATYANSIKSIMESINKCK